MPLEDAAPAADPAVQPGAPDAPPLAAGAPSAPAAPLADTAAAPPADAASHSDTSATPATPPADGAASARKSAVDVLADEFADVEELQKDGWYEDLKPETLRGLDTVSRRFLHNLRLDFKQKLAGLETKQAEADRALETRKAALDRAEADLVRRQAEFAAVFDSPAARASMKPPEGPPPDPLTPEGQKALIDRQVREAYIAQNAPVLQAASEIRQKAAYLELVERHPEMKEDAFKKDVHALWKARKDAGTPLHPEDAIRLIKADRLAAAHAEKQETERQARAAAAKHVQRATQGGAGNLGIVPPELLKPGRAGDLARYLRDNPQAHAAVRRQLGR